MVALFDVGFVVAFLTLNISLIPGLSGEYQPIIFLVGAICALGLFGAENQQSYIVFIGFLLSITLSTVLGFLYKTESLNSLIRCLVGPVFFLAAYPLLNVISIRVLKLIIWIHLIFAFIGLTVPNVLISFVSSIGLRGVTYYDGWNAFFASEPSYAAINLAAIVAIMILKTSSVINKGFKNPLGSSRFYIAASAVIMLITKSVTGVFFSGLLFLALFKKKRQEGSKHFDLGKIVAVIICVVLGLIIWFTQGEKNRVARFFAIVFSESEDSSFFDILSAEQSGAWRLIANIAGISSIFTYPFGLADVNLQGRIGELLPPYFADLAEKSSVYLSSVGDIYPQTVVANYAMYGGFPAAGIVFAVAVVGSYEAIKKLEGEFRLYVVLYIVIGIVWQSALTAPGWWLVVGYLFSSKFNNIQRDTR